MTPPVSAPLRIVCFFAHPDDPEFSIGGSAARWADEGAEITYVVVTNGAAGSNDPNQDLANLVRLRQEEQRCAANVCGVKEVRFLGYADGTLQPTIELRRDLTRIIRQIKPDRVVSGDPTAILYGDGYINHPDHRAAAEAAVYAVFPSSETRPIFPELLAEGYEPHKVKELWISGSTEPNTWVDISTTIERKIESLRCHESQVQIDDGKWIREWAVETAKGQEMPFAEAFRVMRLVREDADTPQGDADSALAQPPETATNG